jgi:hypothetical protein
MGGALVYAYAATDAFILLFLTYSLIAIVIPWAIDLIS